MGVAPPTAAPCCQQTSTGSCSQFENDFSEAYFRCEEEEEKKWLHSCKYLRSLGNGGDSAAWCCSSSRRSPTSTSHHQGLWVIWQPCVHPAGCGTKLEWLASASEAHFLSQASIFGSLLFPVQLEDLVVELSRVARNTQTRLWALWGRRQEAEVTFFLMVLLKK